MKEFIKPRLKTLYLAILAGAAIALGGLLYILAVAYLPDNNIIDKKLVGSLLFPVGLLVVCYFKLSLYTGKIGMAFRNKKLDKCGLNVFEWLFIILIGNALGAFLCGLIFYPIIVYLPDSKFAVATLNVSNIRNITYDFEGLFGMSYKSILCGVLVYLAIYFFNRSNNHFGKIFGIIVPITLFVFAGFQHCVANMFYLAISGLWNGNYLLGLLISTLGNSLGAILIDLLVKYE